MEDMVITQRKELLEHMSEMETYLLRKTENIHRAIGTFSKELNLTNPLSLLTTWFLITLFELGLDYLLNYTEL